MTVHFEDSVGAQTLPVSALESASRTGKFGIYRSVGKRACDILFVLTAAPIGLVLVIIAALLSAVGGRHWPFFYQLRVGRSGRVFRLVKIRTMIPNAHEHLEAYLAKNPAARREWNEKQKLENDPRITRFGNLLRKTSLDELPQMWNVLLGDMSVVGPRPMMASQRDLYPGTEYYLLRPCMTGFWQISERNDVSFASRARYDRDYWHDVSFSTDVKVIFDTVGVVYKASGH